MSKEKSKSIFPTFLLPSLKLPLRPTRAIDFSLTRKPAAPTPVRLTRCNADTLRCTTCSADLAFSSQIISKGFTGRHGRAYLVGPPTSDPTSTPPSSYSTPDLINVRVGRCESRQLVTGWHTVADISCSVCHAKLGWKYVDAKEYTQRYKVGKFILETERVVTYRSWEDAPVTPTGSSSGDSGGVTADPEEEVEFDSDDEDECDDIFAGTWDRESVARRRNRRVGSRGS